MSPDKLDQDGEPDRQVLRLAGRRPRGTGHRRAIRKFWEPRMRNAIFAHLDAGGAGLDPLVRAAVEAVKKASEPFIF